VRSIRRAHPALAQRPRRTRRWLRPVASASVVGLLVVVAVWQKDRILTSSPLRVREIRVEGLGCMSEAELLGWIGLEEGMSLLEIPAHRFGEAVGAFPRIRAADWTWRPFGVVSVTVEEREPVALLLPEDGGAWEVSPDGVAWPVRASLPDMPLVDVTGRLSSARLIQEGERGRVLGLHAVLRWMEHLKGRHSKVWAEVSQVRPMAPGLWRMTLCTSHRVLIVPEEVSLDRWDAVGTILADLDRRRHDDAVLDLRFAEQVVVRLPGSPVSEGVHPPQGSPS